MDPMFTTASFASAADPVFRKPSRRSVLEVEYLNVCAWAVWAKANRPSPATIALFSWLLIWLIKALGSLVKMDFNSLQFM